MISMSRHVCLEVPSFPVSTVRVLLVVSISRDCLSRISFFTPYLFHKSVTSIRPRGQVSSRGTQATKYYSKTVQEKYIVKSFAVRNIPLFSYRSNVALTSMKYIDSANLHGITAVSIELVSGSHESVFPDRPAPSYTHWTRATTYSCIVPFDRLPLA